MMGEILQLLAWFVGVLFVPALALVMGVWTRHSRFFEITYLLLWYVGPFEGVPSFDFAGITSEAITRGIPWVYLTLAILLFGIALIGRTKRLK
jgi:hypothetical protein